MAKPSTEKQGLFKRFFFFEFFVVGNESFLDMGGSCVMGHFLVDSPYKVVLVLEYVLYILYITVMPDLRASTRRGHAITYPLCGGSFLVTTSRYGLVQYVPSNTACMLGKRCFASTHSASLQHTPNTENKNEQRGRTIRGGVGGTECDQGRFASQGVATTGRLG